MLAHAEPLGNLRHPVAPLGNLSHRIALEPVTAINLTHRRLLSSKLGKKASTNLGAIQGTYLGVEPLLLKRLTAVETNLAVLGGVDKLVDVCSLC